MNTEERTAWIDAANKFDMKRITVLLLTAILCLCLTACNKKPALEESPREVHNEESHISNEPEEMRQEDASSIHSGSTATKPEESPQQSVELVGPWHLGGEKNDLAAFADRFPGYAEWGASMEIRSDGLMSWYIGAEGWHGNYVRDQEMLHAELGSDLEQLVLPWDFRIVTEKETTMLEMDYEDMTVYWIYGDQEDVPPMGGNTKVYVDPQGPDDIYSSLFITQDDNDYVIEREIYRLGYFRVTAVKTQGMLFYTDDRLDMQGTIQYNSDHAVFEVTKSSSDLVQVGETWVFPEIQEG